ncbi:hypothetical protein LXL04_007068 [Taraxacum kok-saghyz]
MTEKGVGQFRDTETQKDGVGGKNVDAGQDVEGLNSGDGGVLMEDKRGGEVGVEQVVDNCSYTSAPNDNAENAEFGRDMNRLDYFRVTPLDVHGDQSVGRSIPSYGGANKTRRVPRAIAGVPLRWWEKWWLKLTCRDGCM